MPSSKHAPSTVDDQQDPVESPSTAHFSLSRAVHARRKEYTRPHRIRIKIGTWNVAACPGTDKDLASWFIDGQGLEPYANSHLANLHLSETSVVESEQQQDRVPAADSAQTEDSHHNSEEPSVRLLGGDKIGLYVLGLQEVVSLNLVQQSLYTDSTTIAKWRHALEAGLPKGYELVACQQMVGLLLLIYASPEVAATISNESTVSVGTGLLGYMGNKGAVSSRLLLGDTTSLVFANCHLSSGHDQTSLERRWWDYGKILSQTRFAPISLTGVEEDEEAKIGDEDYAFLFGDLNFRLDGLPGEDIKRILTLHTTGEYDLANPSKKVTDRDDTVIVNHNHPENDPDGTKTPGMVSRETSFNEGMDRNDESDEELPDPDDFIPDPHDDPASLQATLDSLLPHDQLAHTIKDRKALHEGWREGPITFLPTYKYDVGTTSHFDSSEKKRAPSWCDRILYRTKKNLHDYENRVKDEAEARKKDEDMRKRGIDAAADDESVLFDYNPTSDAASSGDTAVASENLYDYDEYEESGEEDGHLNTQTLDRDEIKLDIYTSHHRITSSDHKPLVGIFTLDYEAVIPELKAKVHAEVAKELDRAENEGRPGITIVVDGREPNESDQSKIVPEGDLVDFGEVAFLDKKTRSLTIANTGRVSATFSFVDKPDIEDGNRRPPQWLHATFASGDEKLSGGPDANSITLEPGETINAHLALHVRSIALVRALNAATRQLEDVLVLRVDGGRDHFVPVRASWKPTCFGRYLEELIRIPHGGIDKLVEEKQLRGPIPRSSEVQNSSPAELYKLTEAIESLSERAIADENMIEDCHIPRDSPGWPFSSALHAASVMDSHNAHVATIVRALEADKPILDALNAEVPTLQRLEAVCEVLVLFLRSMPDGIITAALWAQIDSTIPDLGRHGGPSVGLEQSKSIILDILSSSPYNNISFVFLTSMLGKIANDVNPLNKAELLAIANKSSGAGGGGTNIASRTIRGAIGVSRGLSFRRAQGNPTGATPPKTTTEDTSSSTTAKEVVDEAAVDRRLAWERQAAEIIGGAMCRPPHAHMPGASSGGGGGGGGHAANNKQDQQGYEGEDEYDGSASTLPPAPPMSPREKKITAQDKTAALVEIFFRKDENGM
ncbi:Endonuclease/exonuclease/phosphatase [Microdochium trichocladiopsis]|uniref:Endonuclease/exonuclease/phosphatase n=1 Tax=Microdochium trichocladiopsis TaxID=1682393 RepID=A0A9P8Y8H4_9PEZI|nr:Endonuclease/exonuclease/phosphatase [Microdochium trichocladiopsis]KAH7032646.1 Endonuclease/exonuclease/phosphatase [Microdochium trichocladiopsis]